MMEQYSKVLPTTESDKRIVKTIVPHNERKQLQSYILCN